jgi:hypothetical protein
MTVWTAEYNDMVCESDFGIIAVCKTKRLALEIMRSHRRREKKSFHEVHFRAWRVVKHTVLEEVRVKQEAKP